MMKSKLTTKRIERISPMRLQQVLMDLARIDRNDKAPFEKIPSELVGTFEEYAKNPPVVKLKRKSPDPRQAVLSLATKHPRTQRFIQEIATWIYEESPTPTYTEMTKRIVAFANALEEVKEIFLKDFGYPIAEPRTMNKLRHLEKKLRKTMADYGWYGLKGQKGLLSLVDENLDVAEAWQCLLDRVAAFTNDLEKSSRMRKNAKRGRPMSEREAAVNRLFSSLPNAPNKNRVAKKIAIYLHSNGLRHKDVTILSKAIYDATGRK